MDQNMADDQNNLVSLERQGFEQYSGCAYTIKLTISLSASATSPNPDWCMQVLNVTNGNYETRWSTTYHIGFSGVITVAHHQRMADFPIAATRDDAVALMFDVAFDRVQGNYLEGSVKIEIYCPDDENSQSGVVDLTFEKLGPLDYPPAPARREAVEALEKVTIAVGDGEETSCAVCLDEFSVGCEATKMPCAHVFHTDCIGKWLQNRFACPIRRFKLPSE